MSFLTIEHVDRVIGAATGRPVSGSGALEARVLALFFATGLFALVGVVTSYVGAGPTPPAVLPLAVGAVAALWWRALRHGRTPLVLQLVELALLGAIGIASGDPVRATGVFYMALYYRNLPSKPRVAIARSAAVFAVYFAGDVVTNGLAHTLTPDVLANFPGMVVSGLVASLLGTALRRQSRIDESKDEFLSMVSHELRSPLAAIEGFTDLLDHRWDQLSPEQRRQFLDRIRDNVQRQRGLVEDLLDTAHLATGTLEVDRVPTALRPLVDETAEHLGLSEVVTNVVDADVVVLADPRHVGQILSNLLSNADKYGAPPIVVSASGAADDRVTLRVRDHGRGIPEALHDAIFERFARAGERDRNGRRGFGLGMAIARAMARANGGDLLVEQPDGPGACFTLVLPGAGDVQYSPRPGGLTPLLA